MALTVFAQALSNSLESIYKNINSAVQITGFGGLKVNKLCEKREFLK